MVSRVGRRRSGRGTCSYLRMFFLNIGSESQALGWDSRQYLSKSSKLMPFFRWKRIMRRTRSLAGIFDWGAK